MARSFRKTDSMHEQSDGSKIDSPLQHLYANGLIL
jgi:hypothetical protein